MINITLFMKKFNTTALAGKSAPTIGKTFITRGEPNQTTTK